MSCNTSHYWLKHKSPIQEWQQKDWRSPLGPQCLNTIVGINAKNNFLTQRDSIA